MPQPALNMNLTAVLFNDMANDGKAETGSAHGSRACFVDSVEPLKDAGQVFGRNALTCVTDADGDPSVLGVFPLDPDLSVF